MTALEWLLCACAGPPAGVLAGWWCNRLCDYLAARHHRAPPR